MNFISVNTFIDALKGYYKASMIGHGIDCFCPICDKGKIGYVPYFSWDAMSLNFQLEKAGVNDLKVVTQKCGNS